MSVLNIQIGEKFLGLFEPYRNKAFHGGRGSGKSHAIATALVLLSRLPKGCRKVCARATNRDALTIVCARQFQSSIRDSVKSLIENKIADFGFDGEFSIQKQEITHKITKSRFIFIGLERNPSSQKSLEGADICWVEEAQTINQHSMEILIPTIRKPGSEIWWGWNPVHRTDPVDAYFRGNDQKSKGKWSPPPRSLVVEVGVDDNPFFYQSELPDEMWHMQRGNPKRAKHIWGGDYDDNFDSQIFTNVEIGRVDVPEYVAPRYGMDFGFGKDPSFVVKVYPILERKIIYIAREWMGCVPSPQLPAAIDSVIDSRDDLIKADSAMPDMIEQLQAKGYNIVGAKKGPGSIKAGINWLQGHKIIIDPDCEAMREEARLYSWQIDKITKQALSVPVDAHNHGFDSCRYALEDLVVTDNDRAADDDGIMFFRM